MGKRSGMPGTQAQGMLAAVIVVVIVILTMVFIIIVSCKV